MHNTVVGPIFKADTCRTAQIAITEAMLPYGMTFVPDEFICFKQEVIRPATSGDSVYWLRTNQAWTNPPNIGYLSNDKLVITMGNQAIARDSNAITRLILPTFDLSGIFDDPVLSIQYALPNRNAVDSLKVYYRTGGTGDWTLIASYGNRAGATPSTFWSNVDIELPNKQPYYQIAFEAKMMGGGDNGGGGVYIDSISIKSVKDFNLAALSPLPNSTGQSVTPTVSARFNRNIAKGDNFANITIKDAKGTNFVDSAVILTTSASTVSIRHRKLFDTTTYTVHLPAGAITSLGGSPNRDTSWSFTTTRESLAAGVFTPSANQTGVIPNTEI
jgi:hypothetical protein